MHYIISMACARRTQAASSRLFGLGLLLYAASALSAPISLEQAWQIAEQANPALRSAKAEIEAVEGAAKDANAALWNNPQISGDLVHRTIPSSQNANEWRLGLSQTFEIAGQQGFRREASQQEFGAASAMLEETRRQLRSEVELRFIKVLGLQERIAIENETINLIKGAAEAVGKRVKVGEDTKLEGNLASVEASRAANQIVVLKEQLIQVRSDLANTLQLPPDQLPEVTGDLHFAVPAYSVDDLLASTTSRSLLKAIEHKRLAASSRLNLERAAVSPDVTIGLSAGQEGPSGNRENLTGVSVSIPLPLFRKNATGISRAMADVTQTEIEKSVAEREAKAQVVALWNRMQSIRARLSSLNETILPRLEENQRLANRAFKAGEIGLIDLIVVSRQSIDGRRDGLDAQIELAQTRVALEQAAGWSVSTHESPEPSPEVAPIKVMEQK